MFDSWNVHEDPTSVCRGRDVKATVEDDRLILEIPLDRNGELTKRGQSRRIVSVSKNLPEGIRYDLNVFRRLPPRERSKTRNEAPDAA
jgi:hypothetical protein